MTNLVTLSMRACRRRAHARQRFETHTTCGMCPSGLPVGEELMRDSALKLPALAADVELDFLVGEELMRDSALKHHNFF